MKKDKIKAKSEVITVKEAENLIINAMYKKYFAKKEKEKKDEKRK